MAGFYATHYDLFPFWVHWAMHHNVFLKVSAAMYIVFAVGLFMLGAEYHAAIVRQKPQEGPGQFPPGYFTMLVVQLLPLMITGFVLPDDFIIGTRVGTLIVVLIVYGMVSSKDGSFNTWWHCIWATLWLSVAIIGTMFWVESVMVRKFVHDYEKWIAYASIACMILFVIKGQRDVAKALFHHFVKGNYTLKRFRLQIARFLAFALQAFHYFLVPSKAEPFLGLDPIFVNGALGTIGVVLVIGGSIAGWVKGKAARLELRRKPKPALVT